MIHFHLSSSPSNYLQEIGRAGRDGRQSQAISLYQPDDAYILETILFADRITPEDINQFELGQFIPPEKETILSILYNQYTIAKLHYIFDQSYKRKKLGYSRMLGYKQLDQCRRKYLLEFLMNNQKSQINVVIMIQNYLKLKSLTVKR